MLNKFGNTVALVFVLAVVSYVGLLTWELNIGGIEGEAAHIDFVVFWAAAKLALSGEAILAFDPSRLVQAQSIGGEWPIYPWFYPPTFHMLITPLGWLPFSAAFAVFTAIGLSLYTWGVWQFARPVPAGLAFAVAAPPVAFAILTGNVTLLWTAAFLPALSGLRGNRPALAGLAIAALTLKPQLGLAIAVALIAGRYWGAFVWAAAGSVALCVVSLFAFGVDYWFKFFDIMKDNIATYEEFGQNAVTMVTWYAFGRQIWLSHDSALLLQFWLLLFGVAGLYLTWSKDAISFDLKAAMLCLITLIVTPYAYQYELVLAVVAGLFLLRHDSRNWKLALLLWAMPVPAWLIGPVELAQYAAPVLTLVAWHLLLAARSCASET